MGVKLAKALGHDVVAISSTANKKDAALQKGANHFVVSSDPDSIKDATGKCDIILNTVSADHDVNVYMPLLGKGGTIVQLGLVKKPHSVHQMPLMFERKSIAGSLIGGIKATQEVVDFCFKHSIYPDCKMIESKELNEAWDALKTGKNVDAIRFVLDVKKSLADDGQKPI